MTTREPDTVDDTDANELRADGGLPGHVKAMLLAVLLVILFVVVVDVLHVVGLF